MPGFTAIISNEKPIASDFKFREKNIYGLENRYVRRRISGNGFVVEQFVNQKFPNDKVFAEDADFVAGIDGAILNLTYLQNKTNSQTAFEMLKKLYFAENEDFVKHLRGSFSGFIFDKKEKRWTIFADATGGKRIFFYKNNDLLFFSSELKEISFLLSKFNLNKNLNRNAAYFLLTCGFMLEDNTLLENVKRLMPGNMLIINNNKLETKEFFHLKNIQKTSLCKTEIIETMDSLFSEAVRLQFEKDKENDYQHIATLSGGLDSRMTVLTAHKLGYTEQLNFTFSQSDYLDEKIAKRIAIDHHHDFLFHSLDYGNYLKNIDKTVFYNDGLILYSGGAHIFNAVEDINLNRYGIVHTGLIGDAVIGSFLSVPRAIKPAVEMGIHSKVLLPEIQHVITEITQKYETEELYKFYSRAFLGAMNGALFLDIFSETASPFLNLDFLAFCYSIPEHLKYKEQIYIEWIGKRHREFDGYIWEKTGVSPLKSNNYKKYCSLGYYNRMSGKFFDRMSGKTKSGMNPFDRWLIENISLKNYIENYFSRNISVLDKHEKLQTQCRFAFQTGNSQDKFIVLTLLAAIKLHFE
ncbi:MAG: hypothetical protein LBS01_01385 [Prevotellaceae bacterium]|jgi:asparagine synthase (glutamine-hydrolysing)|nr:hypothetical protein [Prevotellaceae bacterium]